MAGQSVPRDRKSENTAETESHDPIRAALRLTRLFSSARDALHAGTVILDNGASATLDRKYEVCRRGPGLRMTISNFALEDFSAEVRSWDQEHEENSFWWDAKYAVLLLPPRPESKTAGDLSSNPAVMWAERASDVQWQMDSVVP